MSSDGEHDTPQAEGYSLTASQVSYLREKLPLYQDASKKAERDDVAKRAGNHLIKEIETLTSSPLSQQKKALIRGVSSFFVLIILYSV